MSLDFSVDVGNKQMNFNTGYLAKQADGAVTVSLGDVKVFATVVAARSVVTKDISPYTVVGGNPARIIRKRFSDEEIAMLLEMKWWDWSEEEIKLALPYFTKGVKELYKYWK